MIIRFQTGCVLIFLFFSFIQELSVSLLLQLHFFIEHIDTADNII